MSNPTNRRNFVKRSALSIGVAGLSPALAFAATTTKKQEKHLTIICLGAHPGDPEFGCGGTMAKYSKAGHKVIFLYLTRGEAYNSKQSFETSAALRTKEAETACKLIGATPLFMGQIDGNTELNNKQTEQATSQILSLQPDIVFTQWPVDSHPDHQVTGLLALTAWTRSKKKFDLYFYEVNTGSETMAFSPTNYVDITNVRDVKKLALMAHQTQEPEKVYDDFFKTMEEFRGLEAGVKAAEAFVYFKGENAPSVIGL